MPENNYELEFELSDGSKKTAIITIPQGPMGPTGPQGPQVSTYAVSLTGKNSSGTTSSATFYTSETPASGWHITIDDGTL